MYKKSITITDSELNLTTHFQLTVT